MAGKFKNTVTGSMCLLLLFSVIATSFRCDDERPPQFEELIFVLPLTIRPTDSILRKNDTLWISAEIPDTIFEYNTGKYLKLPNFNFYTRIGFFKLIDNQIILSDQPGATESFNYLNLVGSITNMRDTFADFNFYYTNNQYICRIGIIPKFTGVYCINFLRPEMLEVSKVINLGQTSDGRKRIPVYRTIYYVINDGKTNFELYKNNCVASSEILVTTDMIYYEQKGTFTFRVVE
jgi:hypothetical protein